MSNRRRTVVEPPFASALCKTALGLIAFSASFASFQLLFWLLASFHSAPLLSLRPCVASLEALICHALHRCSYVSIPSLRFGLRRSLILSLSPVFLFRVLLASLALTRSPFLAPLFRFAVSLPMSMFYLPLASLASIHFAEFCVPALRFERSTFSRFVRSDLSFAFTVTTS